METLYEVLHRAQTTLFCLMQKTWVYHWNVVGSDFFQLHEAFGEQYTTMIAEVDRLTEHMRYLKMKAVAPISLVADISQVLEATPGATDRTMVAQLYKDNQKIIEIFSEAVEAAESAKQRATSNLLQDLIESHGKNVWMLRSFLKE
jgi:starvation-inducible DNA-binding protein